jgi:hypothetical protein
MIIPVTCPGGAGTPVWYLLEMQGKVLPAGSLGAGAALDGHLMGRLDASPQPGRFSLQVGTYRMTGALKPLAKPLLVLRRAAAAGAGAGAGLAEDGEAGDGADDGAGDDAACEYVVHAIIRQRFVFNERPQQMVGTARTGGAGGKEDVA